jgi:hypothetical protein
MKIDINKLRVVAQRAFEAVEQRYGATVELNKDLYWSVPTEARYNGDVDPKQLDVGSLADDYEQISKVVTGEHDVVRYDFAYLGNIFIALGETVDVQSAQ